LPQVPAWPRVQSVLTFRSQGKLRENVRTNCRALCKSSKQFRLSQILIATIERPRRTSPGAPSLFCLVPPTAPHQFPTARTAQTKTILVRCEAASMRSCGRRLAGRAMIECFTRLEFNSIAAGPSGYCVSFSGVAGQITEMSFE
jgi:hypothetical protein